MEEPYGIGNTKQKVEQSSPGDSPVRLDLEDGGVIGVVELDVWVPQLGRVDIHHDRGCAGDLSRRGHTHDLLVASPDGTKAKRQGEKERDPELDLHLWLCEGYEIELHLSLGMNHFPDARKKLPQTHTHGNSDKASHAEHLSVSPLVVSSEIRVGLQRSPSVHPPVSLSVCSSCPPAAPLWPRELHWHIRLVDSV